MEQLFVGDETVRTLRAGPLGQHVDGLVEFLPRPATSQDASKPRFSCWRSSAVGWSGAGWEFAMSMKLGLANSCGAGAAGIEESARAHAALVQLLRHLRTAGVLDPIVVSNHAGTMALIEGHYAAYLRQ
jgi:hypothetical protein